MNFLHIFKNFWKDPHLGKYVLEKHWFPGFYPNQLCFGEVSQAFQAVETQKE